MSLFITELAFENETYMVQAKIGILSASLLAGIIGFIYLRLLNPVKKTKVPNAELEKEKTPTKSQKMEV